MSTAKGGASQPPNMRLPGKAGGAVAVRRTLASTICQIADPTQVPRPRQLRDASTVMRSRPAHQSMINRRFNDRASCPARQSPKPALARRPRIHSPASGKGGHESGPVVIQGKVDNVMSMLDIEDSASIQIMGKIDGGPSDWRILKSKGNVDIAEVGDRIVLLTCIGHDLTT